MFHQGVRATGLGGAAIIVASLSASAGIAVMQIETPEAAVSTTVYSNFAPVDLSGSTTVAGTGAYSALTFRLADTSAGATASISGHAQNVVAPVYYASGTPGNPTPSSSLFITDVWADSVYHFHNTVVAPSVVLGASAKPRYFYGGSTAPSGTQVIRVVNGSYVVPNSSGSGNTSFIRRLDYMIDREDVVFTAGAVTHVNGTFYGTLPWSSFNTLAVQGSHGNGQSFSVAGSVGKQHADLWTADALASAASPRVAGYAAGLIGQAATWAQSDSSFTNAQKGVVVRSLLMTGADRTASLAGDTWAINTANNLDTLLGAGKADYNKSRTILDAGARSIAAASGTSVGSTITSPTAYSAATHSKGWAYESIAKNGEQALVFTVGSGKTLSDLVATLTWNVTSNSNATQVNTNDASLIFADLSLALVQVNVSGSNYTLGSILGYSGLTSDATNDNIESLYWKAGGSESIGPGTYAFLIADKSTGTYVTSTSYGFSYSMTLIPEPASLALLAIGSAMIFHHRRKK